MQPLTLSQPYYELRQNIDRKKAITHVDTDKSGNWDPDQEAKERQKKALRARVAKKERKQKKEIPLRFNDFWIIDADLSCAGLC